DPQGNVEQYERWKRAELPFVFVDRTVPAVSADAVMTDHRLAGQLVAEHLVQRGRKNIGILGPLHEVTVATSVYERIAGIDDVAIAGYDDLDVCPYVIPSLTSIRQPTRQIAWEAVKMLFARIGGGRTDDAITIKLRPTLMERDSTPKVTPPRDGN